MTSETRRFRERAVEAMQWNGVEDGLAEFAERHGFVYWLDAMGCLFIGTAPRDRTQVIRGEWILFTSRGVLSRMPDAYFRQVYESVDVCDRPASPEGTV